MDNREEFEAWAKTHGGLDLTMHEAMDNEKLPSPCTYYSYTTEIAWRAFANKKEPARAALASQQQDHIGDSNKLVQAVNALAAQTGESAESITEWLTDKGGLTQLMLSHFGGIASQAQQEPVSSDYTVLIGRLAYALKKANPDSDLPLKATEFIQRKGHTFDPLRDASQAQQEPNFQARVKPWMMECFGAEISADSIERNHRFLEEALELVQACGCTQSEAHQLVDYVFGRPVGEKNQEVGGVMVTLAALCLAQGLDMHEAGETELARIWTKVDQIRAKQAAKPKHSPLPQSQAQQEPLKVSENWREPLSADAMQRLKNLGVLDKSPAPKNGGQK